MCQSAGTTGIYLPAKQEQTHKDHEQKLQQWVEAVF